MISFVIDTPDTVRDVLADRIALRIEQNNPVLFLVSGGSTSSVAVAVCESLAHRFSANRNPLKWLLTVSLVDERFGPRDHLDSNWQLLLKNGFNPADVSAIPVLRHDTATDADLADTVNHYNSFLTEAVKRHSTGDMFITGLFGIGKGGFTAGILPESPAAAMGIDERDFGTSYKSALFTRITITPAMFPHIDFALAWAAGEEKRAEIAALGKTAEHRDQPAQLLKRVKECIVVSD
jgi:6-phosphogluconolactonase/glucosamine-6-phosphate isomerase/deaminase